MGIRKYVLASTLGTTLAIGSCNLSDFSTTSTVTLDSREVVSFLVRSWLLTPIETLINNGIDKFFDQFDDDEDA